MTHYAINTDGGALLATWTDRTGHVAQHVTTCPEPNSPHLDKVARRLTDLSTAAWRIYAHPPTADDELTRTRWRHDWYGSRLPAIRDVITTQANAPDAPAATDLYLPVEDEASQLGRALHRCDPAFTATILDEVSRDMTAIGRAELGDYTGRASQALNITRTHISAGEVMIAVEHLRRNMLGDDLTDHVAPGAACVAAAHYLAAAIRVTNQTTGSAPHSTPTPENNEFAALLDNRVQVLDEIWAGSTARAAVHALLTDGIALASGAAPDQDTLTRIASRLARATQYLDAAGPIATPPGVRLISVDPARPAPDLLDDLLLALDGVWQLWQRHSPTTASGSEQPQTTEDHYDTATKGCNASPAAAAAEETRTRAQFIAAVIADADLHAQRLM